MKGAIATKTGALTTAGVYRAVAATMGLKSKHVKAAFEGIMKLALDEANRMYYNRGRTEGFFTVAAMVKVKVSVKFTGEQFRYVDGIIQFGKFTRSQTVVRLFAMKKFKSMIN